MFRTSTLLAVALIAGSAVTTMARAEDSSSSFDQQLGNGLAGSQGGFVSRSVSMPRHSSHRFSQRGLTSRSVSMSRRASPKAMNRASQVREGGAK